MCSVVLFYYNGVGQFPSDYECPICIHVRLITDHSNAILLRIVIYNNDDIHIRKVFITPEGAIARKTEI